MDPREELLEQKIASLERRIAYLERIGKVSQILNSTLSLEPLLRIIIQSATELTHTEACSIMLLDKRTGELHFTHSIGEGSEGLRNLSVPLDNSIAGWIVRKSKPLLIRDAKADPRWHSQVDKRIDFDTRSILGVPMKVKDQVIGVMELLNKLDDRGFSQDDIQIATTLAAQAGIAIENARLLDELQRAYDELAELDRLKSDFVSVASHELRTPLSVILGYASFLREEVSGEAGSDVSVLEEEPWDPGTLLLPEGEWTLTATARDWSGNESSDTVHVYVGVPAPDDLPDDGGTEDGGTDDGGTGDDGTGGGPDGGWVDDGGDDDKGCGCVTTRAPAPLGILVLLIALARRRAR